MVVFGSAALLLDRNFAPRLTGRMTNDIDVILPSGRELAIDADAQFWDAISATNRELEGRNVQRGAHETRARRLNPCLYHGLGGSRVWRRCQRFFDLQYRGALDSPINRGNYRCDVSEAIGAAQAFDAALVETCDRHGWRIHAAPYRWIANTLKVDRPASMRAQVHRRSLHVSP